MASRRWNSEECTIMSALRPLQRVLGGGLAPNSGAWARGKVGHAGGLGTREGVVEFFRLPQLGHLLV